MSGHGNRRIQANDSPDKKGYPARKYNIEDERFVYWKATDYPNLVGGGREHGPRSEGRISKQSPFAPLVSI
jgi:hypothetical protein